jgi:prephenate dehydratase
MTKLEFYSVVVRNKPGKGAELLTAFKKAGVNFVGIWGYPVGVDQEAVECPVDRRK